MKIKPPSEPTRRTRIIARTLRKLFNYTRRPLSRIILYLFFSPPEPLLFFFSPPLPLSFLPLPNFLPTTHPQYYTPLFASICYSSLLLFLSLSQPSLTLNFSLSSIVRHMQNPIFSFPLTSNDFYYLSFPFPNPLPLVYHTVYQLFLPISQ